VCPTPTTLVTFRLSLPFHSRSKLRCTRIISYSRKLTGAPPADGIRRIVPPSPATEFPTHLSCSASGRSIHVLPSRSTSISNTLAPLRLPLSPPPNIYTPFGLPPQPPSLSQSPELSPPSSLSGQDLERDSYFTPIPALHPSPPVQTGVARRYTVLVSPQCPFLVLRSFNSTAISPFFKAETTRPR